MFFLIPSPPLLPQAAAEELMLLVDTDADGSIDLAEFLDFQQKVRPGFLL